MRTHRPGEIIDARYVLLRFLGARGGGDVWEAEHQLSGRRVSIKILPAEKPEKASEEEGDEGDEAVLVAEARAVGQIAPHPNIVDIYDLGATPEGAPYLVMEAVEGETLADLLARKVRIQADDACNIALQILAALETAHAAGVVHGGLSPSGILLPSALGDAKSPEGKGPDTKGWSPRVGSDKKGVKVLDFGMYAERGPTDAASARYAAPERREPRRAGATDPVDARADIFSLGAILFEMLTSEPAFPPSPAPREGKARSGAAEPPTLPAANTPPHKRLAAMLPSLPAQIVDVIERALKPSIAERPGSAIEMAALLYPFANRATMTSVSPRSTGMPFLSPEARKSRGMARLERAVLGAPESGAARPEGPRSEAARPEPARPEPTGVSREPERPRLVLLDPRANRPLVASNRSERSPGRQPGSAALAHKSAEPRPQSDPNTLPSDTSMLSSGVPADTRGHSDEPGTSEPPENDDALSSADLMEPRIPRPPRAPRSLASPRLARLRAVMRAVRSRRPTLHLDPSSSSDSTQGGRFGRYGSAEDGGAGLSRDREDENRMRAGQEPGTTVGSLVLLGVLFLLAGILLERLFHF